MNRNNRLLFLDGLRGLSALYVMIFHARWLLWEGFVDGYLKHPEQYAPLAKGLAYIFLGFSFGRQMVMLFFVLSGFVIHLRYARQLKAEPETARFNWRDYLYRRLKRLYPPLIFAMLLTFALDRLGMAAGYPVYFGPTVLQLDFKPVHDLLTAIGNLAFTMNVYVQHWGMNGALWSLRFEWWFYMFYPAFWWLTKRSIGLATTIIVGLFALSFFPLNNFLVLFQSTFSLMLAWWFGVLLADIYTGRLRFKFWRLAPLTGLVLVLAPLTILAPPRDAVWSVSLDILWSLAFTGLIAACLAWQNRGSSLRWLEWFKPLGDTSYTLYVTHLPILIFMSGWLMIQSPAQALPQDVGWALAGMVVCLGVAYLAHFITEKPFVGARRVVTNP